MNLTACIDFLRTDLATAANAEKAVSMQAYMKTDMPFYGVQKPGRSPILRWIEDDDMWLRRAAIICQVGAKEATDADRLFHFCEQRAHETEFFIRNAIGWALREYAKTDPESVARFAMDHREEMSGLSYREATKHIGHLVRA